VGERVYKRGVVCLCVRGVVVFFGQKHDLRMRVVRMCERDLRCIESR